MKINVAIVGASGYTGEELVRLLAPDRLPDTKLDETTGLL